MEALYHVLWLACLVLTAYSLPSARQCLRNQNDTKVASLCEAYRKYKTEHMPSHDSIYFSVNNTLRPPTKEIPERFFPLSRFDLHRDARFYRDLWIPHRNRHLMLIKIYEEFLNFARDNDLKYWLVHGGLIGWYWNEQLLPWDSDLDVMVLYHDLIHKYSKFHKTVYKNRFLFEINPNSYYREFQESDVIDARFIDKTNGLYVDITAVVYDPVRKQLHCKSPHYYDVEDVFPLRNGTFIGFETWIPNNPSLMLTKEYSENCLTGTKFYKLKIFLDQKYGKQYFKFNEEKQVWEYDTHPPKQPGKDTPRIG